MNSKGACAKCKTSISILATHHMDFNHANDASDNLMVLCTNCHWGLHNKKWKLEDIGLITPDKLLTPAPENVLTNTQSDAIGQIKNIETHFGVRWFVQAELAGITLHTMKALVLKGYLEEQEYEELPYYRWKGKE